MHSFAFFVTLLYLFIRPSIQKEVIVMVGETGSGKSTLAHHLKNKTISCDESTCSTIRIAHLKTNSRGEELLILDTPGFLNDHGIHDEEILRDVLKEILRLDVHEFKILFMIGTHFSLKVKNFISQMRKIFDNSCINESTLFIMNSKFLSTTKLEDRDELVNNYKALISKQGINPEKLFFKQSLKENDDFYSDILNKSKSLIGCQPPLLREYLEKAEKYYDEELKRETNYYYQEFPIYSTEEETIQRTEMVLETYEEETFEWACKTKIFLACISKELVKVKINKVRYVPKLIYETRIKTISKTETIKQLKNDHKFYKDIAIERVISDL